MMTHLFPKTMIGMTMLGLLLCVWNIPKAECLVPFGMLSIHTDAREARNKLGNNIISRESIMAMRGGRTPGTPDNVPDRVQEGRWKVRPPSSPTETRLIIVQITDVYTLENFASLKTLIKEIKSLSQLPPNQVISVLTGDFLSPYLLSSIDRGSGMMKALADTPIDYVTWGNHEADMSHKIVCSHVKNYPGKWLNSNMVDHEAMDHQLTHDVISLNSEDRSNERKVGLAAVLSNDPALYSQFSAPGAFGGATITDPWETLAHYKNMLESDEVGCDVVVPLQHLYVPDDHVTCRKFDFPVVLSGHDHHRVDEVVDGTRLLKPGLDGVYATVLELIWDDAKKEQRRPRVEATFVKCSDWEPDPVLKESTTRAYDALLPLRNTELSRVPPSFQPLSSVNSRGCVCTMGRYICTLLRSSLNTRKRQRKHDVDAVLLMGGNVRGGTEYDVDAFFSLEALEAEVKSDETIAVVPMPGWVLAKGVEETHAGDPIPGWMQYDDGVRQEEGTGGKTVTHVGGNPIEMDRMYRVATKISDLANGQSPTWTEYYGDGGEGKKLLPPKGAYVNIFAELMSYFAKNFWRKIWEAISLDIGASKDIRELCDVENCQAEERMAVLDKNKDGTVTVEEIHTALRDLVGLSVDDNEMSLAKFVHSFADITGNGEVTLEDFETFCEDMPSLYENDKWRLAFPKNVGSGSSVQQVT